MPAFGDPYLVGQVWLRHLADGTWAVAAVTPADRDIDDTTCSCPMLESEPHCHADYPDTLDPNIGTTDREAAARVYARWASDLQGRRQPSDQSVTSGVVTE